MLVASLINFGVTNQVLQVFFKLATGDLMLVSYYEFSDIRFCELLVISEEISYYEAQSFTLHSPSASLPLVPCSSPHRTSKEEGILHPPGYMLLTLRADFTTHGLLFKAETYQFLECSHMVRILKHFFSLIN